GERLTVVHGPNGAGKTNLLEALYFGCTGRSCRTSTEREVVRFDADAARVEVGGRDRDGDHELSVGLAAGEANRRKVDEATAEGLAAELEARLDSDLERGFPGHGPHRDELLLLRDHRELRVYGSQGEQRLALLALLLAERDALEEERGAPPLLLLDDVMS